MDSSKPFDERDNNNKDDDVIVPDLDPEKQASNNKKSGEQKEQEDDEEEDVVLKSFLLPSSRSNNNNNGTISEQDTEIPGKYKLVSDTRALTNSLRALQFSVLVNAMSLKMLNPNYAIMTSPDASPDSFPNTDPFDFNSATYFIPFCSLIGVALTSNLIGKWSDRIGRKPLLVACQCLGALLNIAKYFTRFAFWPFCAANFAGGLVAGSLPVAMAYIGDVFTTKREKEAQLGIVVGAFVCGNSGGGIVAILMIEEGLFTPLWVAMVLMLISTGIMIRYLLEPGDKKLKPIGIETFDIDDFVVDDNNNHNHNPIHNNNNNNDGLDNEVQEQEEERIQRPTEIDKCCLINIIVGALADNFGSVGLMPLCLSPLALEQYFLQFVEQGQEPIMKITGYQWLLVMVSVMVVPSTRVTPYIFGKLGASGGCVMGNLCTAAVTIALLYIGNGPATHSMFALFVAVLYIGFPFTVFSQLSTGPMLDVIAPADKLGFVQGLNNTVMNFGMAVAPWVLGMLADYAGTNTAIWTAIGICFLSAATNSLLICRPGLGPPKKKLPKAISILPGEDEELVAKILEGEYVHPQKLEIINRARARKGIPCLIPKVKTYEEDKEHFDEMRQQALETFRYKKQNNDRFLAAVSDPSRKAEIQGFIQYLNVNLHPDKDIEDRVYEDLGKWFADYLRDSGYFAHSQSLVAKQMFAAAFPPITHEDTITEENVVDFLLAGRRVTNQYLDLTQRDQYSSERILGDGFVPVWFS